MIFTSVEAFRYIIFVCKVFLANSSVWWNNRCIADLLCQHKNYQHSGLCSSKRDSKTCITRKSRVRMDWKFGNKLILSIPTERCHKSSMLKQNGHLMMQDMTVCLKFTNQVNIHIRQYKNDSFQAAVLIYSKRRRIFISLLFNTSALFFQNHQYIPLISLWLGPI